VIDRAIIILTGREIGRVVRDWCNNNFNELHGIDDDEQILAFEWNNWSRVEPIRLSIVFNIKFWWALGTAYKQEFNRELLCKRLQ